MADISTLMGVNVDTLSKYCGVDSDTINTVLGLTWPHGPEAIGEVWGGGYYVGDMGSYYIIAYDVTATSYTWKDTATVTSGCDSTTDGTLNMADIITAGISDHPAANYCNNFTGGGYSDWYLPAIDELSLMWTNKAALLAAGMSISEVAEYWSSTDYSTTMAQTVDMSDGGVTYVAKNNVRYTRPFRRVAI